MDLFKKKESKTTKSEKDYNNMPMKIYGNLIFEHFSKGLNDVPEDLSYVENQICYNKIFTQNYVEFYFQVKSFGNELFKDENFHAFCVFFSCFLFGL